MPQRKSTSGVLVLVELGAEWPFWVQTISGASSRRVVSQEEGESPDTFADRAAEAISNLVARGIPLKLATVACNERCDSAAMGARRKLSQALASALVTRQPRNTRLFLAASGRTGRVRHALSALASEVGASFGLPGERVSVRFADEMALVREGESASAQVA